MPKNETLQVPCSPFFRFVPYRVARFLARFFATERAAPWPPAPSLIEPYIVRTSFALGRCVTHISSMNCYHLLGGVLAVAIGGSKRRSATSRYPLSRVRYSATGECGVKRVRSISGRSV